MKKTAAFLSFAAALMLAASCSDGVNLTVTGEIINPCYLGNGVEWDPYDEAASWGRQLDDSDWEELYRRLDFMQPQYVRCMINSPFTYYDGGDYDDARNSYNIKKLLGYCQSRGVMVVYGEYNPPSWDLMDSQEWVRASVRHLNWLVTENGFDCIRHFVIFNEPDGNWAAPNGDYDFWKSMVIRFRAEMEKYPGLSEKVTIAGPDAVIDYRNSASPYGFKGWLEHSVQDLSDILGVYDMHAYPGQEYVRSGRFRKTLEELRSMTDKPIILGEAGYKYFSDPADSLLAREYRKRVEGHPFTRGSDCNMLVYDPFYALDMPLLLMSVMNSGFSGAAAWMLDDAMHTNGDSGRPEDLKIWGMWNILGEDVFGDASQEELRPWYWTWSLMCRNFPSGSEILRVRGTLPESFGMTAARTPSGSYSVAMVNYGPEPRSVTLSLPGSCEGYSIQFYGTSLEKRDAPEGKKISFIVPAGTFAILSKE